MSVVTRDEKEAGNNISYTLADHGIGKKKKGSYDVDTPNDNHIGGGSSKHSSDGTRRKRLRQRNLRTAKMCQPLRRRKPTL